MIPKEPLPLNSEWKNAEEYVESLLSFATSSTLFRNLCGGVHILDFLTREPDLYSTLFPADWRHFFDKHSIHDILDLLLREDIEPLRLNDASAANGNENQATWRNGPVPPRELLEYIHQIHRHTFNRQFTPKTKDTSAPLGKIPRHIAVGMKPKKVHEVENFSRYVSSLVEDVDLTNDGEQAGDEDTGGLTHIVDFGSGQNYLGRTLASPPYHKHVIAIEQRQQNITGANRKDSLAKLTKKKVLLRKQNEVGGEQIAATDWHGTECESASVTPTADNDESGESSEKDSSVTVIHMTDDRIGHDELPVSQKSGDGEGMDKKQQQQQQQQHGHIDYVEHEIQDGYLEPIIDHIVKGPQDSYSHESEQSSSLRGPRVMVVSLHSCGNLVHHGIRSLILNPSVAAVAMIGCCYNLMTERLGPQTWKLPTLRSPHRRLERTSSAYDSHGFPMSRRLESFPHESGEGIKLNITARMMAVQAPGNWGPKDSEGFFTRHFFRSLFQRILLDYGVIPKPGASDLVGADDGSGRDEAAGTPLIVGSLRKSAFTSFPAYARAAIAKLVHDKEYGAAIQAKVSGLTDDVFDAYARRYWLAKHNLSVTWSLMAFSAQVVEAIIVTDRWLFLQEQDEVKRAWVEPVFDYAQSPRNLVVVGSKS